MKNQPKAQLDPFENWLSMVSYSHSQSKETDKNYRARFNDFLRFINKSALDIYNEYRDPKTDPRNFEIEYAQYLQAWIATLMKQGLAIGTVKVMAACVKSFFKYNNLRIGFVPTAKNKITYHNRDMTKEEVVLILRTSNVRDRAFFAVMAQSGLRPSEICNLKIKYVELDRDVEAARARASFQSAPLDECWKARLSLHASFGVFLREFSPPSLAQNIQSIELEVCIYHEFKNSNDFKVPLGVTA